MPKLLSGRGLLHQALQKWPNFTGVACPVMTNRSKADHGDHPISLVPPLVFEEFRTKSSIHEPECEQWVTFQIRIQSYGRRGKLQHDLALRLCRVLFQLFGTFEMKLLNNGDTVGEFTFTKNVTYNPDGEGGSVTIK